MKTIGSLFKIKSTFILFSALIFLNHVFSQAPSIEWQKTFGGSYSDMHATSIHQTFDGGFITIGSASSINGDVTGNHGLFDFWVVKMNNNGFTEWKKALGGSKNDYGVCIEQTADSGYILTGTTESNNGDVTNNHGYRDGWIVKLNNKGDIQWQKTVGTSDDDQLFSIHQTTDAGYIAAGYKIHYGKEYLIVKLDSQGNILWQKAFGGSGDDIAYSIIQTVGNGYIVAGESHSSDGDVTGNHGSSDGWIVKLNNEGNIIWQKSLGGSGDDFINSIEQTTDSSYILAGASRSADGDVTGNKGDYDYWIIKLSNDGNIKWEKSYGGSYEDEPRYIKQSKDKGYIVAGYCRSYDGDVINNHTDDSHADCWILKLNDKGMIEWQKTLGGSFDDNASSVEPTKDGGYIISGTTISTDGDITYNHGQDDYWIVKLNSSTLPVNLISFNAAKNAKSVLLTWQTASETNTKNFIAERSIDGIHFDSIATIAAAGNSHTIINYDYSDYQIAKFNIEKIYYRLREVSTDGIFNLSNVIILPVSIAAFDLQASPNPLSNKLTISITTNKQQTIQLLVTNSLGKVIVAERRKLDEGVNTVFYPTASWAKGIYFIKASTESGSAKTLQIAKH